MNTIKSTDVKVDTKSQSHQKMFCWKSGWNQLGGWQNVVLFAATLLAIGLIILPIIDWWMSRK